MTVERRSGNKIAIWGVIITIALQLAGTIFSAGKISSALNSMSASLDKHTQQIDNLILDGRDTKGDIKAMNVKIDNHEVRISRLEDR